MAKVLILYKFIYKMFIGERSLQTNKYRRKKLMTIVLILLPLILKSLGKKKIRNFKVLMEKMWEKEAYIHMLAIAPRPGIVHRWTYLLLFLSFSFAFIRYFTLSQFTIAFPD
jgi:hypothetical protein